MKYKYTGYDAIIQENIPEDLKKRNTWVAWKAVPNAKNPEKKPQKIPINPETGRAAKSNDPTTWGTFKEALNRCKDDNLAGIGLMFSGDNLVGVDLDDIYDENDTTREYTWLNPVAESFVYSLNTYTEISPSGKGLKMWLYSSVHPTKTTGTIHCKSKGREASIDYETYQHGRWFAVTGRKMKVNYGDGMVCDRTERYKRMLELSYAVKTDDKNDNNDKNEQNTHNYNHNEGIKADIDMVRSALTHLDSDTEGTWVKYGMCLKKYGKDIGDNVAFDLWKIWSQTSQKYDHKEVERAWDRFGLRGLGIGTLFKDAKENGYVYGQAKNSDGTCYTVLPKINKQENSEITPMYLDDEYEDINNPQTPWKKINSNDIAKAIKGTRLEVICDALASVTDPPLPYEITLIKALVLCGAALTRPDGFAWKTAYGDDNDDDSLFVKPVKIGVDNLKFKIMSGGGMPCLIWGMIVGDSGSGKDIGNLVNKVAEAMHFGVGTTGSAEGLKDAFARVGCGLMSISELQPYFNPKSWQYSCCEFLTNVFSSGFFKDNMARKNGKSTVRRSALCFPSVIGNIQPGVLEGSAGCAGLYSSGFMQRFLVSLPDRDAMWRPAVEVPGVIGTQQETIINVLSELQEVHGEMYPEEKCLHGLFMKCLEAGVNKSIFARIINEYYTRITCCLAVDPVHPTQDEKARAEVIVMWYIKMAIKLEEKSDMNEQSKAVIQMADKMLEWIIKESKKHPDGKIQKQYFTRRFQRVASDFRDKALDQLIGDGKVNHTRSPDGKISFYSIYKRK